MIEGFGPNNASINQLLMSAANGRGCQAHAEHGSEDSLAAFLIGAGYRAYFGLGGWTGTTVDDHLLPQFSQPLGRPFGDATYDPASSTWARQFIHVNVTFNAITNKGKVDGWAF